MYLILCFSLKLVDETMNFKIKVVISPQIFVLIDLIISYNKANNQRNDSTSNNICSYINKFSNDSHSMTTPFNFSSNNLAHIINIMFISLFHFNVGALLNLDFILLSHFASFCLGCMQNKLIMTVIIKQLLYPCTHTFTRAQHKPPRCHLYLQL